jgi:alkanesulfonate monooxygenase SsuD/methylene tetrahydromethanopterin reductase-like flavin-dependent oxidoreductase (luciferase family)
VGLSPWPEDFEVLREDWAMRGPRSAEMIEIIRGLLAGGMYEFHGRFYDFPRLQIAPVPRAPVPVYIGGLVEPVLRRAARIADGYIGWENPRCSLEEAALIIRRIEGYRRDYERAGSPFEYKFMPYHASPEVRARLADAGVTDLICAPWIATHGPGAGLAERLDAVRRFGDEVISRSR